VTIHSTHVNTVRNVETDVMIGQVMIVDVIENVMIFHVMIGQVMIVDVIENVMIFHVMIGVNMTEDVTEDMIITTRTYAEDMIVIAIVINLRLSMLMNQSSA